MSSRDALDVGLACVEDQIHQQLVSLSHLRTKRNTYFPVFRLPPEMLATIFILGARDYYEVYGGKLTSRTPSWVNVSYVCNYWRNIALDCPTLWSYHFNVSRRWTEELLLRSKQALLKFSWTWGCAHPRVTRPDLWLNNLLGHSERFQELCLDLFELPVNLSLQTQNLEKLEITVSYPEHYDITVTTGDKPSLRNLKLIGCPLPWYSLNLSGLKTLHLCRVRSPSQLDVSEFLLILKGMRDLTSLHLEDVLPSVRHLLSSGCISTPPSIDLPHLARLAIIAPLSTVVVLLSCINVASKIQLSLEPQHERGSSVDDYNLILPFIAQASRSSAPTFRSLIISCDYHPTLMLNTSEHHCEPHLHTCFEDGGHKGCDIPLDITLGMHPDEEIEELGEMGETRLYMTKGDQHRVISNICRSLSLTHVQSLYVTKPEFSTTIWKELLEQLDGLHYMMLKNGSMPDLSMLTLPSLKRKKNLIGRQDPPLSRMLLPALEKLELHSITFKHNYATYEGGMVRKALYHMLSTRKLRGQLTMTKCNVGGLRPMEAWSILD